MTDGSVQVWSPMGDNPGPSPRLRGRTFAFVAGLAGVGAAVSAGLPLDGAAATAAASGALLVVGLPHGAFDFTLIRDQEARVRGGGAAALALYLMCAGAMYLLWRVSPTLALVVFFAVSALHFSEDWAEVGQPFVARSIAVATLAAPALLHRRALGDLFAALTGDRGAALFADTLMLLAPAALCVATVGAGLLWQAGRRDVAVNALAALAAMTLLPPVLGFGLYFCLSHSPRHFAGELARSAGAGPLQWGRFVAPLTLASLGLAALLYRFGAAGAPDARVFTASFMTLSLLTAPHLAVPAILAALGGRAPPTSPSGHR